MMHFDGLQIHYKDGDLRCSCDLLIWRDNLSLLEKNVNQSDQSCYVYLCELFFSNLFRKQAVYPALWKLQPARYKFAETLARSTLDVVAPKTLTLAVETEKPPNRLEAREFFFP